MGVRCTVKKIVTCRDNHHLYCTVLFGGNMLFENSRAALPTGIPERKATPRIVRKAKKTFPAADLIREPISLLSDISNASVITCIYSQ